MITGTNVRPHTESEPNSGLKSWAVSYAETMYGGVVKKAPA